MNRSVTALSGILNSPVRILATVLAIIFAVEAVVMLALPYLIPGSLGQLGTTFIDACLLTLACAPLLWLIIIGPLRRIALQEHQRSETIVANAGEAIVTVDATGRILSANPATVELLGIEFESLLGSSISSFVSDWPAHLARASSELRLQARKSNGELFPVQVSFSQFPSDSQSRWIAIIRDLTAAHQAEQERIAMARQTEALRAQQMTTLAQLATGVAHEIRNPLTSIKMLIQLNQNKLSEQGLPTDDLDIVEREIRRMEHSVNSLLDFARPENVELVDFPIQEAIRRTCQLVAGRCRLQQVEIRVVEPDQPIIIHGDCAQIQQLLVNLCLNAKDAMPRGGVLSITVRLDPERTRGSQAEPGSLDVPSVIVSVSDTGPGIKEEIFGNLFEPFFTTKTNGVGLGLGICKRIAEAHGGTLSAANQGVGGAIFELRLPYPFSQDKATEAKNAAARGQASETAATFSQVDLKSAE